MHNQKGIPNNELYEMFKFFSVLSSDYFYHNYENVYGGAGGNSGVGGNADGNDSNLYSAINTRQNVR